MKKNNWLFGILLLLFSVTFTACEETKDEGEYADWRGKNIAYIDSIADVAKTNADGKWKVFKAWNKPQDDSSIIGGNSNVQDYIYVHVKEEGAGTVSPMYTDSVAASYRGKLINDYVFDETFVSNELNPETAGRATLYVNGVVTGMATALQHMHAGDWWTVYMPYSLAYDSSAKGSIPAYSDLIFELYLAEINPKK